MANSETSTATPNGVKQSDRIIDPGQQRRIEKFKRSSDGTAALFAVIIGGYPIAWALGLAPLLSVAVALLMVNWLVNNSIFRVPQGTIFYVLFLVLVAGSAINLTTPGRAALFAMRTSWYVSALVCLVYLYNQRSKFATVTVVRGFLALWVLTIVGGYLAVLTPELAWSTPISKILPAFVAENEFIFDLITPRAAEIQVFKYDGVVLNRPAAPFPYTNAWGSVMALTTPFAFSAWQDRNVGVPKLVVAVLLAAACVPFYYALNRGAWLTLGVGIIYGLTRYAAIRRDPRPFYFLAILAVIGTAVVLGTGVLETALSQLEVRAGDSNETRTTLYVETIRQAANSPMIGYGSPLPNPVNPSGPPLGTHGQFWAILYAHGIFAVILYCGFFAQGFVTAKASTPIAHWAKVTLLIGLLQIPLYGHLPHQLFIMIGALALANRATGELPAPHPAARTTLRSDESISSQRSSDLSSVQAATSTTTAGQ